MTGQNTLEIYIDTNATRGVNGGRSEHHVVHSRIRLPLTWYGAVQQDRTVKDKKLKVKKHGE